MSDDLAAWLTQIFDERKKAAERWSEHIETWGTCSPDAPDLLEEFARIAADRQILELHTGDNDDPCQEGNWVYVPCPTLRLLAVPYADRPGYQEAWRLG